MALRPARDPLDDVPEQLPDGARLVGVVTAGTPIYHDPDDAVLRTTEQSHESSVDTTDESYRHAIDRDESVADAITTVERQRGWALLSAYGLEHLTDE